MTVMHPSVYFSICSSSTSVSNFGACFCQSLHWETIPINRLLFLYLETEAKWLGVWSFVVFDWHSKGLFTWRLFTQTGQEKPFGTIDAVAKWKLIVIPGAWSHCRGWFWTVSECFRGRWHRHQLQLAHCRIRLERGAGLRRGELNWSDSRIKFLHYDGVMKEEGRGESAGIWRME